MDLNLTTTTINNKECNQLLLNAIKNKFAAKTASDETAALSPPKFNIPILKIPGSESTKENTNKVKSDKNSEESQLNTFLLKKLQEQYKTNGVNKSQGGFVLPNLQFGNKLQYIEETKTKSELPEIITPVSSLTTALNSLQVDENPEKEFNITYKAQTPATSIIDLTSALATKLQNYQQVTPSTRDLKKPFPKYDGELDFEIPFIDCDNIDVGRRTAVLLPTSNECCIIDISKVRLKHTLVEPSAVGRILNCHEYKYTEPLPMKCFSAEFQQQSVKHTIEPFRFDTKSPDDLVMEALNKYQRRYHN